MSNSNYMRLGDCIRPIDVRNRDMLSDKPMGINIDKYFMPSVANVVGTDLSNYKVVEKNQFACNLMHVGRDERLPIAILEQDAPIIVSPAYYVFEIIPGIPLMPSFLMLWFKRPEFDRNAWFYTDADVRGGLDRDTFLDMEIPVPNIDEQRRIVAEYQAVEKRIATNEALIAQLEETAQAIYKKMFVDDVDTENLTEGWRKGKMLDLFELQRGFDLPHHDRNEGPYPIYASNGITGFHNEYRVKAPGVVTGRSGSIGEVFYVSEDFWPLNTSLWVKDFKKSTPYFVYYTLKNIDLNSLVGGSSAVPTLNRNDVNILDTIIPPYSSMLQFDERCAAIENYKRILYREIATLIDFKVSLLAKLTH